MSDRDDKEVIRIPLDGDTADRLRHLASLCGADPISVAASLLHDVLKEDDETHCLIERAPPSTALN